MFHSIITLSLKESRRHLSRLESVGGLGSLVKDISSLEEKADRYESPEKSEGKILIQSRNTGNNISKFFCLLWSTLITVGRSNSVI